MTVVINGSTGISPVTAAGTSALVDGMTVGRGAGEVATNTAVGASALAANTTGADTTAIGYQAGYSNTTGARNTFVGEAAGYLVTNGADNTTLGFGALASGGGSGGAASNNVAIGTSTLKANTASNNTAVGYYAGYSNTTANRNTYIGYSAGYGGTTAEANVAIGHNAGNALTTGSNNAFVGGRSDSGSNQGAGFSVTTGSYNNFFGGSAGGLITTGSKNTIVGNYTGNQGGLDIRTASNYIVLSDGDGNPRAFCNGSNYWGFNTVSPDNTTIITVQANSGGNGMAVKAGTNGNYGIYFNNVANSTVGGIIINSGAVAYNTTSDYRLKENIAPMTGALEKVALLKPCTYTWKADGSSTEGFIAHELAEVCPQAVSGEKDAVNEDGSIKAQGIDTSFLVATLTAAIQELKAEFDAYKEAHP